MPKRMRGFTTQEQEDLWRLVRRLNEAWLKGPAEDLGSLFHESAVIAGPDGKTLAKGASACVASYVDFASRAVVQEFKEQAPEVDVFGATAVVRYGFQIRYEADGKAQNESGRDLLVLSREEDGPWLVVWRQVQS